MATQSGAPPFPTDGNPQNLGILLQLFSLVLHIFFRFGFGLFSFFFLSLLFDLFLVVDAVVFRNDYWKRSLILFLNFLVCILYGKGRIRNCCYFGNEMLHVGIYVVFVFMSFWAVVYHELTAILACQSLLCSQTESKPFKSCLWKSLWC